MGRRLVRIGTDKYGRVRRSGAAHNKLFTPYSSVNIRTHPYRAKRSPQSLQKVGLFADNALDTRCGVRALWGAALYG